jgi:uncharacterized protein YydD (DUF2326 family)
MWGQMKLSKFYSNKPDVFQDVLFRHGLNVVLANIRLPENRDKDTHNLGKTTLGRLLDFGFLSKKENEFFLFKHPNLFKDFTFFLEIELSDATYITVCRSVSTPSKISFKKHAERYGNFVGLPRSEWDHYELPFTRARKMLNSLLGWNTLKPWDYRKGLGYQLRSQKDFGSVFQLQKFAGSHSDWKPFLAHILGFNSSIITLYYKKEVELIKKESEEKIIQNELTDHLIDISTVEGLLLLKQNEIDRKQSLLDSFDFRASDSERTEQLANDLDEQISRLNSERYSLSHKLKKIVAALEENQILFKTSEARKLFEEAGVLFEGQILKDFEQLIAFNQAITAERSVYLQEERNELEKRFQDINSELAVLGKRRSEALAFLSDMTAFEKYKKMSGEVTILKTDITILNRQKDSLHRLQELRAYIRRLKEERAHLQTQIEADVERQNSDKSSLFSTIRLFFSAIVEDVIDRKALLGVSINQHGHLEFKAEILDEAGNSTSADHGYTYKKLLCIAFDLAILRSHLQGEFPRFVYHDGVFESLDDRKKENLLTVINQYTNIGIQIVITSIDSDLPRRNKDNVEPMFTQEQIVLNLHDENQQGRLFKMASW